MLRKILGLRGHYNMSHTVTLAVQQFSCILADSVMPPCLWSSLIPPSRNHPFVSLFCIIFYSILFMYPAHLHLRKLTSSPSCDILILKTDRRSLENWCKSWHSMQRPTNWLQNKTKYTLCIFLNTKLNKIRQIQKTRVASTRKN